MAFQMEICVLKARHCLHVSQRQGFIPLYKGKKCSKIQIFSFELKQWQYRKTVFAESSEEYLSCWVSTLHRSWGTRIYGKRRWWDNYVTSMEMTLSPSYFPWIAADQCFTCSLSILIIKSQHRKTLLWSLQKGVWREKGDTDPDATANCSVSCFSVHI